MKNQNTPAAESRFAALDDLMPLIREQLAAGRGLPAEVSAMNKGSSLLWVLKRIRALPGRSRIAVAHRPAALELCDRNLEMENGKITVKRI